MNFTFKIGQKIKESWVLYKENLKFLLLFTLVTLLLSFVSEKDNYPLSILMMFVNFFISYIWVRSTLNLIDKKEFKPFSSEVIPSWKQYWYFISTGLLTGLIFLGGLILLIVPGFYFMGRLMFGCYIAVDKNKNAIDSIKESWSMTKDYGWKIFWKTFVIGLFILVGFVVLFFGSFITYPIGMIVFVMLYREFQSFKNGTPATSNLTATV